MAKNFKTVGPWRWNTDLLHDKIIKAGDDDCWDWRGAHGPNAALMGAHKNNTPQMTQARRLLYMEQTGLDVSNLQVTHTCNNPLCMNWRHFEVKPNNRLYRQDGTDRRLVPEQQPLQHKRLVPLDKKRWWQL